MSKENYLLKTELISLTKENLNQCIELDKVSLEGFWTRKQWEYELNSPLRLCFCIKKESKIIAIASGAIAKEQLDITFVAVHPSYRRHGLGKKVVKSLLIKAKEKSVNSAVLEVRADNNAALKLYKSLSFKQINIRDKYYKDGEAAKVLIAYI